jgi:Ca2+-binding RTX toxin-like protein
LSPDEVGEGVVATIRVNSKGVGQGGTGNDKILGNSKMNFLFGQGGNDVLKAEGGSDWLEGGTGNDILYGGTGDDLLYGDVGKDTLYGGSGEDIFVFSSRLRSTEVDTVKDFSVKDDTFWLEKSIFTKLGKADAALSSSAFWTGSKAHDLNDRIIYNNKTGVISYDADGTGSKAPVAFAKVTAGLKPTYKDFVIIDL